MVSKITKFLKAFKIFDPDGTLSLSNLGMMVVIFKLATAGNLDWAVLTAFFLALLNHNARKHWSGKAKAKDVSDVGRLDTLEQTIKSVASAAKLNNILK